MSKQSRLSDRRNLGRFREHLNSQEDISALALGRQRAAIPSISPQPTNFPDPFINQNLSRRLRGLPPLELGNRSDPRLNLEFGSSNFYRYLFERPDLATQGYQGRPYLPLFSDAGFFQSRAESAPVYPDLSQPSLEKPKKHRATISVIGSAIKSLFQSKKTRSIKSDNSLNDRNTRNVILSSKFIRKWKRRRAEVAARQRTQALSRKG